MTTITRSFVTLLSVGILSAACASSSDDAGSGDEQDLTAGAAAQKACGDKFAPALAKYKTAVDLANKRLAAKFFCEANNGGALVQRDIADPAGAAVMICPAFEDVIASSPYAAPIRKTLDNNLALRSLTGKLLVLRDSEFQNWSGIGAALPGVKMGTPPEGATGVQASIAFKANGAATWTTREPLDNAPYYENKTLAATYTLEQTGSNQEPPQLTLAREDGKSVTYRLTVGSTAPGDFSSAPEFILTPIRGDVDAFQSVGHKELYSFFEDCSI